MKSFGSLLNLAVLIAGIAGIIYPAFIEPPSGAPPPGVTQALFNLFLEPQLTLAYFMRLLCLVVAIASGYLLIVTKLYSKVPITVVRTAININMNADLSAAVINREQTLRANQSNVTAYFTEMLPTNGGRVVGSKILMDAHCHGCLLVSRLEQTGSDTSGFEVIHHFGRELPYSWYMPLIPGWELKKPVDQMSGLVRSCLAVRTQSVTYTNEFDGPHPFMNFVASTYPQANISIAIEFAGGVPKGFNSYRIKSNGVIPVVLERIGNTRIRIFVDRLQNETLRIVW